MNDLKGISGELKEIADHLAPDRIRHHAGCNPPVWQLVSIRDRLTIEVIKGSRIKLRHGLFALVIAIVLSVFLHHIQLPWFLGLWVLGGFGMMWLIDARIISRERDLGPWLEYNRASDRIIFPREKITVRREDLLAWVVVTAPFEGRRGNGILFAQLHALYRDVTKNDYSMPAILAALPKDGQRLAARLALDTACPLIEIMRRNG